MGRHPSDATLSRYADGDLSGAEKTHLASHLKGCSGCKRRLAEIVHIKDLAESLEPVEVPPGLLAGVRARISASKAPKTQGLWRGIVLGFAISAAIALLILLPHSTTPEPRAEPVTPLVIEPAAEPLGPPLGLAHAQGFGQSSQTNHSDVHVAAYEEPSHDTVILIPLDETARQNLEAAKTPHFRQGPRFHIPQEDEGWIVTVGETIYR
ncbi:hypothetical protein CEE36_02945 [candidate division TA06 bacterium B3_TA06]|uniref:Putative zinc-finger domain-containing protein n=1 Tax=candidate division TA06 bacterium B3_TA06 TaxID=2012487 RepID=A0A532V9K3_UNCT6|nr:MAG: hypothetical protein CEE36_02945 [candidate division TA06 bacterium B3_TA06]